jgi:hypothetical protein
MRVCFAKKHFLQISVAIVLEARTEPNPDPRKRATEKADLVLHVRPAIPPSTKRLIIAFQLNAKLPRSILGPPVTLDLRCSRRPLETDLPASDCTFVRREATEATAGRQSNPSPVASNLLPAAKQVAPVYHIRAAVDETAAAAAAVAAISARCQTLNRAPHFDLDWSSLVDCLRLTRTRWL